MNLKNHEFYEFQNVLHIEIQLLEQQCNTLRLSVLTTKRRAKTERRAIKIAPLPLGLYQLFEDTSETFFSKNSR